MRQDLRYDRFCHGDLLGHTGGSVVWRRCVLRDFGRRLCWIVASAWVVCLLGAASASAQSPAAGDAVTAPSAAQAPVLEPPASPRDAATAKPEAGTSQPESGAAKPEASERTEQRSDGDAGSSEPKPDSANSKAAETAPPAVAVSPARRLVVQSWGGAYGRAQKIAVFDPLKREFGFEVERRRREGASPSQSNADVDVVEVDQSELLEGCRSGAFIKLEGLALAAGKDGRPATEDFLAGGLSPCGVATFAWSSLFVVNDDAFKRRKPSDIKHVFDSRRYPGKRALIPSVPHLVAMAALAAGVPADKLSEILTTQDGADKVFELLEGIRKDIVWVDGSKAGLELLTTDKVAIAMSFSGRLLRATVVGDLRPLWDGHVYDFASWAVRSTTAMQTQAKTFIAAATMPERLAAQARQWPYGPMRRAAIGLAVRHALIDVPLAPLFPTSSERLKQGVRFDPVFWADNRSYYAERLAAFREGFKSGIRIPVPKRRPAAAAPSTKRAGARRPADG